MATDNYAIDNTYGVANFETNQKSLIKASLDEEAIKDLKTYLQNQKNPRNIRIDNYIQRVKTLNNYIPFIDNGTIKLTEREMIRQVMLKGIPVTWYLNLKRASNHNCTTLADLQMVLKPFEEADEVVRKFADQKKKIGGDNPRKDKGQGSYQKGNEGQNLETSLAERRDTTTSGKISRTTNLVPITKATRLMQMKVVLQGEKMNRKLRMKTINLVT